MLQAEALRGEEESSVNGVRITAAKYERWEKRARIDEEQKSTRTKNSVEAFDTPSSVSRSNRISWNPSTDLLSTSRHEQSSDMLIVSPSTPPEDKVNSFTRCGSTEDHLSRSVAISLTEATDHGSSPSALPMGSSERLGSPSNAHVNMDIVQEPEQHFTSPIPLQSPDRDVDVVTRLFSALKMDPIDIPLHIPPTQAVAEEFMPATDTVCLQDLEACDNDRGLMPWEGKQSTLHKTASPGSIEVTPYHNEGKPQQGTVILVSYQCGSRKRTTTGALKYPSVDVIFSSARVIELDPFSREVYPFPPDQGRGLEVRPTATVYDATRMNMNDHITKINKLESAALGSNAAATKARWGLAAAYYNLGHFDKAEYQYKQILSAFEQIDRRNSWDYISVKLDLANAISRFGRYQEGNRIAQDAHILARRLYPDSSLYQYAARVLANTFGRLGDIERENALLRDLIQIRLNASGPKNGKTINVIRKLCYSMVESGRYSDGEELLRIVLELSSTATDVSDWEQCNIRWTFCQLLYSQDRHADSEALLRQTAKMSETLLGIEHEQTFKCKILLCDVLKRQNILLERYDILLEMLKVQIEKLKEVRGSTIETMADLSVVLIEMRKMDDAYRWMKQALCYCVEIGGIENDCVEQFFEDLSSIDEVDERYEFILNLYEEKAIDISWVDAVSNDIVLSTLSPQPCLLLLDSQRRSSCLSASATGTKYPHEGPNS